jgi:hypothetical protein
MVPLRVTLSEVEGWLAPSPCAKRIPSLPSERANENGRRLQSYVVARRPRHRFELSLLPRAGNLALSQ